jgi:hypothetical protein
MSMVSEATHPGLLSTYCATTGNKPYLMIMGFQTVLFTPSPVQVTHFEEQGSFWIDLSAWICKGLQSLMDHYEADLPAL